MELLLELEGQGPLPPLPQAGANLVAFMSFAVMRGFGAQHPFIALADRLHDTHRVSLGPLTTFYEADIADAEDATKLAQAWQEAEPLLRSAAAIAAAIAADPQCQALARRAGAEGLAQELTALALHLSASGGRRARLSYRL